MTQHSFDNAAFVCERCKASKPLADMCAAITNDDGLKATWCIDCWDNDPQAVEQYRAMGREEDRKA